jgi:hypothetical protein
MKTLAYSILVVCGFVVGCGGSPATTTPPTQTNTLAITWTDDGNKLVPVCQTTLANCKSSLMVIDTTTSTRTNLPITALAYTAPNAADTYEVHVLGYDGQGNSLESPCCTVTKQ